MSEWKMKRGTDEITVGDTTALKAMAQQGKLKPEDYVLNPVLQQWMYARDAAELQGIFASQSSNAKAEEYNKLSLGLGVVGLLLLFLFPLAGVMVLVAAIGLSVMYYVNKK
jgi:hypothetical protein